MAGTNVAHLDKPWMEFFGLVSGAPALERLEPLAKKLTEAHYTGPVTLVEATATEVLEALTGVAGADASFVRRVVAKANELAKINAASLQLAVVSPHGGSVVQPEVVANIHSMFGNEASALQLAEQLASTSARPDVSAMLEKASLQDMPEVFSPAEELFRALHGASEAAKKAGRKAFTFIDFTHAALLPEFLPPEAVGGRTQVAGADEVLAGYTGNLGQLSGALKALTTSPRMLRNMTQWSLAFSRYAVVAIAAEQVDWKFVTMHTQNVLRVSIENNSTVGILYDELLRKNWARRASKNDSSLDISAEAADISMKTVELAKSRVSLVTKAAGLKTGSEGAASSSNGALEKAEDVMSKQIALATRVTKQAEQAIQRMQRGGQGQNQHSQGSSGHKGNEKKRQGGGKGGGGNNNNFWKKQKRGR